jgi:hypothetical protein
MQSLLRHKTNHTCKSADATQADKPGRVHTVGATRSPETGKTGGWAAKVAGEFGEQRTPNHPEL